MVNAKPLSILKNAGTQPLILVAAKVQWPKQLTDLFEELLDKLPAYGEQIAEADLLDEEQAAKLEIVNKKVVPLITEGYEIFRDKICVSLDKHESLLAVAAQLTTDTLGDDSQEIETPLPIPEVASAARLSNKDLFLSGCEDLHAWFNQVVDLVRELDPSAVPETYSIPLPQEETIAGGTRYYYDLPEGSLPFEGIQVQVLVTEDIVAFGYSSRQVIDMAEPKPLLTRPAWLTNDSEVASVAYVDLAGILAAMRPWIALGLTSSFGNLDEPIDDENEFPVPTGNDILLIWDCLSAIGKTASTTTIDRSGATLSRWVWVGE